MLVYRGEKNKRYKITKRQTDAKWPEKLAAEVGETDADGGANNDGGEELVVGVGWGVKDTGFHISHKHRRWWSIHAHRCTVIT